MSNKKMTRDEVQYFAIQAIQNFTEFVGHTSLQEQEVAMKELITTTELILRCKKGMPNDKNAKPSVDALLAFKEIKAIYEKNFAVDEFFSSEIH